MNRMILLVSFFGLVSCSNDWKETRFQECQEYRLSLGTLEKCISDTNCQRDSKTYYLIEKYKKYVDKCNEELI